MRPISSAYDRAAIDAAEAAEECLDTDAAVVGDSIEYEEWEELDDMARDTLTRRLEDRGLWLYDDSCRLVVCAIDDMTPRLFG